MDATYVRNLCNSIHLKEGVKARLLLLFTTEKYKEATQSELLSILTETSRPTLSRSLNQLINSEEKILSSNFLIKI